MGKNKTSHDLSAAELWELYQQKKINGREARIRAYRASGRVIREEDAPVNEELKLNEKKQQRTRSESGKFRRIDRILLFVEVAAVIGIIVLFGKSTTLLRQVNEEAAKAMILPTLTETPQIRAVVLPGGHTAPDSNGAAFFNESEIPEHLRSVILTDKPAATPIPQADPIVRLRIAAIGVDAPVVWGDDWEALKSGVGLNTSSAKAGEPGNVILSAHNDIYGQLFRELDQLAPGDEVSVLTEKNAYTYVVTGTRIVRPDQVEILDQTPDSMLTLISCYPYLIDTQRIVVSAKLR